MSSSFNAIIKPFNETLNLFGNLKNKIRGIVDGIGQLPEQHAAVSKAILEIPREQIVLHAASLAQGGQVTGNFEQTVNHINNLLGRASLNSQLITDFKSEADKLVELLTSNIASVKKLWSSFLAEIEPFLRLQESIAPLLVTRHDYQTRVDLAEPVSPAAPVQETHVNGAWSDECKLFDSKVNPEDSIYKIMVDVFRKFKLSKDTPLYPILKRIQDESTKLHGKQKQVLNVILYNNFQTEDKQKITAEDLLNRRDVIERVYGTTQAQLIFGSTNATSALRQLRNELELYFN